MAETVYNNRYAYALIGLESAATWGTAVACTKDLGLIQTITPQLNNNLQEVATIGQRNLSGIFGGTFSAKVSIEGFFQHGRILGYALGRPVDNTTPADHANTTNDYKHTFVELEALSSFTLEDGVDGTSDVTNTYAGCRVDKLTLSVGKRGILTFKADLIAQKMTTGISAGTKVISTLATLPFYSAILSTGASGGEVVQGNVQNISWTVNNNLDPVESCESRLITELQPTRRQYEISFTMMFKNKVEQELFMGATVTPATGTPTIPSMIININNGVTLGSGRREFYFKTTDAYYDTMDKPVVIKGYIMQNFKAKCISANSCFSTDNITGANW